MTPPEVAWKLACESCPAPRREPHRYLTLTLSRKRAYFPAPFLPLGDLVEQFPV